MTTFHVQIWHAKVPSFLAEQLDFFPASNVYRHVADLAVQACTTELALERAFELTQHGVDETLEGWTQGAEITLLHEAAARSSAVGDVFVVEGRAYGVLGSGFRPIVKRGREANRKGDVSSGLTAPQRAQ